MNLRSTLCTTAVAALVAAAPLPAQTLSGNVTVSRATSTALYTIDFTGNPYESAALFVGFQLSPVGPLPVPGLGTLYIDPSTMFLATMVPLDGSGRGTLLLVPPVPSIGVVFQAAFLGGTGVRLSTSFIGMQHHIAANDVWTAIASSYNARTNTLRAGVWEARGSIVEVVLVRGGVRTVISRHTLQTDSFETWDINVAIQAGDDIEFEINGAVEATHHY
ncbi:MAG: hypothetical protein IPM29_31285 [Planctomycetes bacterium]|nr:hypothetical protein [Planctomycetota bacterium]